MQDFSSYGQAIAPNLIIERFRDRYVDRKRMTRVILMWNSFLPQYKPRCLPTEELSHLNIPGDKRVVFYREPENLLYKTTFSAVVEYVCQLEPWESVDAYVFDGTMDWVIAITHEDAILCLGL